MKEIVSVTIAVAVMFGVCALAVDRFDDRETFIPPPDAVAEGFAREVVTKRWDRAREYLADPQSMSNAEIAALQKSWEQRVGDPSVIEAETISHDDAHASVNVRMKSAKGSEAVAFALTFDGEWKIVAR